MARLSISILLAISTFVLYGNASILNDTDSMDDFDDYITYSNQMKKYGHHHHPCSRDQKPERKYFYFDTHLENTLTSACGDCPTTISDCWNKNCVTGTGIDKSIFHFKDTGIGPNFELCANDIVVIDHMCEFHGTPLHFHGITQWQTPYMDGVDRLTQCKLQPSAVNRYEFVATDIGTHLWYPLADLSRSDNYLGAFIVRSRDEPFSHLYETDKHVLVFNEWNKLSGPEQLSTLDSPEVKTEGFVINGRGNECKEDPRNTASVKYPDVCTDYPLAEFMVEKKKHHRLRLINGGTFSCPIQFQIQKHIMTVIAADGMPIIPVRNVRTIILCPGERYDVLIGTKHQVGAYWIIIKGLGECAEKKIYQRALLIYKGSKSKVPSIPNPGYTAFKKRTVLNPMNKHCIGNKKVDESHHHHKSICAYQLKEYPNRNINNNGYYKCKEYAESESLSSSTESGSKRKYSESESNSNSLESESLSNSSESCETDQRRHIQINLNFKIVATQMVAGASEVKGYFNNIQFVMPSDLIYIADNIIHDYPDFACKKDGSLEKCFHVIYIKEGDLVDIVFRDEDEDNILPTPFHLHGFKFELLYQGHDIDDANDMSHYSTQPSIRDTLVVPAGGVARIRFSADNIGLWLLRTTRDQVYEAGLGVVLQVGDIREFPAIPEYLRECAP